MQTANQIEL